VTLTSLLVAAAVIVVVPAAVFLVECLAALLPARAAAKTSERPPRMAVVVPAHDEEKGIGATVAGLRTQLRAGDRLVVVADNCQDGTAAAARDAGATVIERSDPARRGKGFAIVFGLDHLAPDPPDVIVLVDADCRVSEGGLARLAEQAARTGRPIQGEYLLRAPERPTPLSVISALAILVRNRVRPRGLARLGMPCQLTGSGMAFPWKVLREAPETGSNLVEDLVIGLELALAGTPALACPEAAIESELPDRDSAAVGQRRRWEHGQMATALRYGPRLVAAAFTRARLDLLALALDLLVPPLALLVTLLGLAAALALGAALILKVSLLPAVILAAGLGAVALGVFTSWAAFARDSLPLRYLLAIPLYLAWKIPVYLAFFLRRRQSSWERTRRRGEGGG
jgi:cellulose synthase/poly-beta-1,6-N-acetylglucosamine synthase-like glycosyltransferase